MSNYLDDLFSAKTPQVRYVWTRTDAEPSSGWPSVEFASGILHYMPAPIYRGRPRGLPRYVDTKVRVWGATAGRTAVNLNPSSPPFATVDWVDQLMIFPSGSSYVVMYGKRADFSVEFSAFTPEIYTGSGFPGFPEAITGVLISRYWLGADCLVLASPDSFPDQGSASSEG